MNQWRFETPSVRVLFSFLEVTPLEPGDEGEEDAIKSRTANSEKATFFAMVASAADISKKV